MERSGRSKLDEWSCGRRRVKRQAAACRGGRLRRGLVEWRWNGCVTRDWRVGDRDKEDKETREERSVGSR